MQGAGVAIELGIGAPSEMFRAMQHLLHAHLQGHVGMRADPDTACGDIAQHHVEDAAIPAVGDRIDPHQNAIEPPQLRAHLVHEIIGVHRRLGRNALLGQCREHAAEPVVLRRCGAARIAVTAPHYAKPKTLLLAHVAALPRNGSRIVRAGVERHGAAADRVPCRDATLQRSRVVASPPQFPHRVAADLEAVDAIHRDRPVAWQGFCPTIDRHQDCAASRRGSCRCGARCRPPDRHRATPAARAAWRRAALPRRSPRHPPAVRRTR